MHCRWIYGVGISGQTKHIQAAEPETHGGEELCRIYSQLKHIAPVEFFLVMKGLKPHP